MVVCLFQAFQMLVNAGLITSMVALSALCLVLPWSEWCGDIFVFLITFGMYMVFIKFFKHKAPIVATYASKESCASSVEDPIDCSSADADVDSHVESHVVTNDCTDLDYATIMASLRQNSWGRDISRALQNFHLLEKSHSSITGEAYNFILRVWINCGNLHAAEEWLERMLENSVADALSFNMLIKALVRSESFDKALALKRKMETDGIQPNIVTFNELLDGSSRQGYFDDGVSALEEIEAHGLQPNVSTAHATRRLWDGSRKFTNGRDYSDVVKHIRSIVPCLSEYLSCQGRAFDCKQENVCPYPALASSVFRAESVMPNKCLHEIDVMGRLAHVKAVRKTLKQQGFLDRSEDEAWPLDGHWETEHGLTVVIEKKIARWSRQRSSKLKIMGNDRRSCALVIYGVSATGRVVVPGLAPGATKTLRWDNGDVWHSYGYRIIGQAVLSSQSMTKIFRDRLQDGICQAKIRGALQCTCIAGLLESNLLSLVVQFIGSDSYRLKVLFQSAGSLALPICGEADDIDLLCSLSQRNPRAGFRHCWVQAGVSSIGQRTLVNGDEVDEACFKSHLRDA